MTGEWQTVGPQNDPFAIDDLRNRRRRFNERGRSEFIKTAVGQHRRITGRPMTAEELQRVLRRFPGDL